jgi:hypothetical protein
VSSNIEHADTPGAKSSRYRQVLAGGALSLSVIALVQMLSVTNPGVAFYASLFSFAFAMPPLVGTLIVFQITDDLKGATWHSPFLGWMYNVGLGLSYSGLVWLMFHLCEWAGVIFGISTTLSFWAVFLHFYWFIRFKARQNPSRGKITRPLKD